MFKRIASGISTALFIMSSAYLAGLGWYKAKELVGRESYLKGQLDASKYICETLTDELEKMVKETENASDSE